MMRNLKRGISFVLTLSMMFSLITGLQTFASGKTLNVTSRLSTTTVIKGGTVVQTIALEDFVGVVGGVQAFKIVVLYDDANFTLSVKSANQDIINTYNELTLTKSTDKLVIIYISSNSYRYTPAGDVLIITYTAKADANIEGATNITLSSGNTINYVDCAYSDVTPTFVNATRTINITSNTILNHIISNTYNIDLTKSYICGIEKNTSITLLKSKLSNPSDQIRVFYKNGTENLNNNIGTGMKVKLYYGNECLQTLTVVIKGDVDGDGYVGLGDLVSIRNDLLEFERLSDEYKSAGDLYGEGKITLNDLVGIMAYI